MTSPKPRPRRAPPDRSAARSPGSPRGHRRSPPGPGRVSAILAAAAGRIAIPATSGAQIAGNAGTALAYACYGGRPLTRSTRILVVDDEVNARTALAELLRDEGYEVEMAADAFKALGKYESFAPDVVVTDLKMPGMDGIELVKKIRSEEDPAAVVVMTAFGAVQTAVDAMRAGAADYLTKPLNFDELLVVLDRVLETERLRRETRQLRQRVRERVASTSLIGVAP